MQYAAVSGVTDDDAGTASGVQRAADQLGGSAGVTLYVGGGFAFTIDEMSPYVVSSGLSIIGLCIAAFISAGIATPHDTVAGASSTSDS